MTLTNHDNVVFWGDNMKFHPNPLHKTKFEDYKPYRIPTHHMPIKKMALHSYYSKFPHLEQFSINKSNFKHPHFKDLHTDPVKMKYELYKVPHLGIKAEMERKSRPNEVKLEMGMGDKTTVKDFARSNLQEEVGEENTLTRHRDEQKYDITVLPFEQQYLNFLKEKDMGKQEINEAKKDIVDSDMISKRDKDKMVQDIDQTKAEVIDNKLKPRRKKLRVEPITNVASENESLRTPIRNESNSANHSLDENVNNLAQEFEEVDKDDSPLSKINAVFHKSDSSKSPTNEQIQMALKNNVPLGRVTTQAGLLKKLRTALKQGEQGFVSQEVTRLQTPLSKKID